MFEVGHQDPCRPGFAVLTYRATFGCAVPARDFAAFAQVNWLARQGFVVLASP
jgi:hypothetical protein